MFFPISDISKVILSLDRDTVGSSLELHQLNDSSRTGKCLQNLREKNIIEEMVEMFVKLVLVPGF